MNYQMITRQLVILPQPFLTAPFSVPSVLKPHSLAAQRRPLHLKHPIHTPLALLKLRLGHFPLSRFLHPLAPLTHAVPQKHHHLPLHPPSKPLRSLYADIFINPASALEKLEEVASVAAIVPRVYEMVKTPLLYAGKSIGFSRGGKDWRARRGQGKTSSMLGINQMGRRADIECIRPSSRILLNCPHDL